MNIALVTQSYYPRPGGVTEHVFHTARELRRRGHDVTIVTANFGTVSEDEDHVVRIGRNVLFPINGAWVNMTVGIGLGGKLRSLLHALRPDVIHTHCPLAPTLPLMTLKAAPSSARVVGTFHAAATGSLAYHVFKNQLRSLADRLDSRIAVSQAALDFAQKYVPGNYTIVPNGVDCQRFSPQVEPFEHFRDGAFNILFVGRLDKRKGLKYLFRAMTTLSQRVPQRLRLIVVGDDGLRRHLLPELPRRVSMHFAGVVSREVLPRYFASADVFCSPATGRESFGIVLLEAMASGLPVIGSAIPGYLTILQHGINSMVVPPCDPASLSDTMANLISDALLRKRLRENALNFVYQYRWERVTDRLEAIYEEDRNLGVLDPIADRAVLGASASAR